LLRQFSILSPQGLHVGLPPLHICIYFLTGDLDDFVLIRVASLKLNRMLTSIELVKVGLPVQQVQAGLLELCPRINNVLFHAIGKFGTQRTIPRQQTRRRRCASR
jgi:hypothetical protein